MWVLETWHNAMDRTWHYDWAFKKFYFYYYACIIACFQNHNVLTAITSHRQLRLSGVWNRPTKLLELWLTQTVNDAVGTLDQMQPWIATGLNAKFSEFDVNVVRHLSTSSLFHCCFICVTYNSTSQLSLRVPHNHILLADIFALSQILVILESNCSKSCTPYVY